MMMCLPHAVLYRYITERERDIWQAVPQGRLQVADGQPAVICIMELRFYIGNDLFFVMMYVPGQYTQT